MQLQAFTVNPFQENTYVLYDTSGECIIIDPGFYTAGEQQLLLNFLFEKQLKPVRLLNTHCHIDHIFGNKFIADRFGLELEIHADDLPVLQRGREMAMYYSLKYEDSPIPSAFLKAGEYVHFGNSTLKVLFTPGHSPGSISFYNSEDGFVIGGDVLFRESIGRTDLPGGDFGTLIRSINTELMVLPEDTLVYSGHGPHTTIGYEKGNNPFLNRQ